MKIGLDDLKKLVIIIDLSIQVICKNEPSIINTTHNIICILIKSFLRIIILSINILITQKQLIRIFDLIDTSKF